MAKAVGPRKELGTRYTCFSCSAKFYDLHRPVPSCPKCGADQRENPNRVQAPPVPIEPIPKPPPKKRPEAKVVLPKAETTDTDEDSLGDEKDVLGTPEIDDDLDEEIGS